MGNAQEMVKQAKILAEATSSLVNAIKREAQDEKDHDAHKRLLDAAKALADATSRMVEAAKVAAKNPNVINYYRSVHVFCLPNETSLACR